MPDKKSKIEQVKIENGNVSFVIQQKHLMKPEELRVRYKSLLKTLVALNEEKQKIEEIAKILNINLN